MIVLPLIGYFGLIIGFMFLTLSIASGLYYLSELVEEHSVLSSRLLKRLIFSVIAAIALLWLIDGFPLHLTTLSIASHAVYLLNLRQFPYVKLSDPVFILSGVLVIFNHWCWFRFFSSPDSFMRQSGGWFGSLSKPKPVARHGGYYTSDLYGSQPTFTEIASYFGLCVWLVPFALFISLSAGENVLPSMGKEYATGHTSPLSPGVGSSGMPSIAGVTASSSTMSNGPGYKRHKRRNTGMAKAAVDSVREWIGENGAVMGLWKRDNVRGF